MKVFSRRKAHKVDTSNIPIEERRKMAEEFACHMSKELQPPANKYGASTSQVLHENTLGQSKGALLQQPVVKDDSTSNQNSHEGGVQLDAINTNLEQMLNQYKGYIFITILGVVGLLVNLLFSALVTITVTAILLALIGTIFTHFKVCKY